MILNDLKIYNFKNIINFEEEFSNSLNCFTGANGVGKTNILDAIHYLSFTKSYFNNLDLKNIRHNESFFAIHGQYSINENKYKIGCIQKIKQKKLFTLDDKPYKHFSEHIGRFPLIMISPYDHDLINDGSDVRRKFADIVLSQFQHDYLEALIAYNKLLLQRNNMLKNFSENSTTDYSLIELLNEQMSKYGIIIYRKRKKFFSEIIPVFQKIYNIISNSDEQVDLRYLSQLEDNDFIEMLKQSIEKDIILKYTTIGIHKDNIELCIDDYPIKNFGSQGQQKSYIIAMKLAQFYYIREHKKTNPILLLDDIFDKLDESRVNNIIKLVSNDHFGQVFITDTNSERIEKLLMQTDKEGKQFKIGNNE